MLPEPKPDTCICSVEVLAIATVAFGRFHHSEITGAVLQRSQASAFWASPAGCQFVRVSPFAGALAPMWSKWNPTLGTAFTTAGSSSGWIGASSFTAAELPIRTWAFGE